MPRRKTDCNHLLNFKSNISPDLQSSATASAPSKGKGRNHKSGKQYQKKKYDPKKQQEARQEKRVREKLNSSFYLHSSASHSFVIARSKDCDQHRPRVSVGGEGTARYLKGGGCAGVVDWDVVKIVKVQVPISSSPTTFGPTSSEISKHHKDGDAAISTCTICLDSFAAPRITKCGHVYCLPCILRHFHSSDNLAQTQKSSSQQLQQRHLRDPMAKCPCCFNFVQLSELRPVQFVTVQSPHNSTTMAFHKCHRQRSSIVPFLPFPAPTIKEKNCSSEKNGADHQNITCLPKKSFIRKREDANDIPSVTDPDAPNCRYNYMDTSSYIHLLENDLSSLRSEMQITTNMYKNFKASNSKRDNITGDLDLYFIGMAIENVEADHRKAVSCLEEQINLRNEQESKYCAKHKLKVTPFNNNNSNDSMVKYSDGKEEVVNDRGGNNISIADTNKNKLSLDCAEDNGSKSASSTKHRRKKSARPRANSMHLTPGTMYLNDDCIQFYQAVDGQLCFLCGFNLKCLAFDFTEKAGTKSKFSNRNQTRNLKTDDSVKMNIVNEKDYALPPFPDILSGQIVDIRPVHITPEVQRRMPFTSHLPLYIDINLVELNLTQMLSPKTREHFRNEIEQRKKKRQSQRNFERKAKKKAEKEEMERIEKLKERIQIIDVNDEFFHASTSSNIASLSQNPNRNDSDFVGDSFGPTLSSLHTVDASATASGPSSSTSAANNAARSYGSVCASNGFFPRLASSNSEAFPSLSSSSVSTRPTKQNELSKQKNTNRASSSKAKDKVVLFSTGGRRGYAK